MACGDLSWAARNPLNQPYLCPEVGVIEFLYYFILDLFLVIVVVYLLHCWFCPRG